MGYEWGGGEGGAALMLVVWEWMAGTGPKVAACGWLGETWPEPAICE
jgi:hypothetical protein